ncbi:MAG TPA: hypothetical protein PKN48_01375 [Bacteroidales bacterium]|nr:hypothetical protein [Bacteroidales bacterium]
MKHLLITLLILSFSMTLFGQNFSYRAGKCDTKSDYCPKIALFHQTSYNFGGLGINSVNADIIVFCNRNYMASIRAGINYLSFPKVHAAGAPLEFNFMVGRGAWLFEAGLGVDYLYFYKSYPKFEGLVNTNFSYLAATGMIGIRYERVNGFFLRAGYNPHYTVMGFEELKPVCGHPFVHMVAIGIGYTFNN